MTRLKNHVKKILAAALAMLVALTSLPLALAANDGEMRLGVISDIHYFAVSDMGENGEPCQAFLDYSHRKNREYELSPALLDTALDAIKKHAETNGLKYILLPGDLTNDGEYAAHSELAARLEQFEAETGIQVFVTNGNHDINNSYAASYSSGVKQAGRKTSPQEFKEIYKNLGYAQAESVYTPPEGKTAGMLSYSVRLDGGFRLISVDACKYSSDATGNGSDEHDLGGKITDDLMLWIKEQIAQAKAAGEEVIGMMHHAVTEHFSYQREIFGGFILDDWLRTGETLADAGMHYVFTGHVHNNDVATLVSDNGETIYDIVTPSITQFPNYFKEVLFEKKDGKITASMETFDVDCESAVTAWGTTYDRPFAQSYSFGQSYGREGLTEFAVNLLSLYLTDFCNQTMLNGGIVATLEKSFAIDIENIVKGFLGNGIYLGKIAVFTYDNIAGFIKDFGAQIDKRYMENPEALIGIIRNACDKILSLQVSDMPCTKYIDTFGFGDADKPGTLEDMAYSVIVAFYQGDESLEDDPFAADALDFFENRDGAKELFNILLDIVLEDIVKEELLSSLHLNINTLFPEGVFGYNIGRILQMVLTKLLGGDTSFMNVVDFVFNLGFLEYKSLDDIIGHYIEEYLTQSQFDSLGHTIADMLKSFLDDSDPVIDADINAVLAYDGAVAVEPTVEAYRLPSNIAVTFGEESETSRSITWLTKYSLTETEIEIVPFSDSPVFSGVPTVGAGIETFSEVVERNVPGVDIGIIGFMNYNETLVRHTVRLTGLEAGKSYCYRLGDSARGWWSDVGVISAADADSDSFTFIHVTDPQSQNEKQYQTWANVVRQAYKLHPESAFIVSSGDQVDSGENLKQWTWLFNTASDTLMSTPFMPTTGNHEDEAAVLDENFILPGVPAQDTDSGVYYSYDYKNAHFAVLNTNDITDDKLDEEQLDWLKKDMSASDAEWKIMVLHKALYSNGSHYDDDEVLGMREQLASLLPELGIDVVLQGHDHVYLRTDAMNGNKVAHSRTVTETFGGLSYEVKQYPRGTVYSIPACSGVKSYLAKDAALTDVLFPRAEKIVDTEYPVFSAIRVDGEKLYYDSYAVDGDTIVRIDSFAIAKDDAAKSNGLATPTDWGDGKNDRVSIGTLLASLTDSVDVNIDVDFSGLEDFTLPARNETTTAPSTAPTTEPTTGGKTTPPKTGSGGKLTAVCVLLLATAGAALLSAKKRKETDE